MPLVWATGAAALAVLLCAWVCEAAAARRGLVRRYTPQTMWQLVRVPSSTADATVALDDLTARLACWRGRRRTRRVLDERLGFELSDLTQQPEVVLDERWVRLRGELARARDRRRRVTRVLELAAHDVLCRDAGRRRTVTDLLALWRAWYLPGGHLTVAANPRVCPPAWLHAIEVHATAGDPTIVVVGTLPATLALRMQRARPDAVGLLDAPDRLTGPTGDLALELWSTAGGEGVYATLAACLLDAGALTGDQPARQVSRAAA